MSDFHERLRQRKSELLSEKLPSSPEAVSPIDLRRIELEDKIERFKQALVKVLLGACIFMGLFSAAIFKDWYEFVGSPEYAQWRQRVESSR